MGVFSLPLSFTLPGSSAPVPTSPGIPAVPADPRVSRLRQFFAKLRCPVVGMEQDFVRAADDNHLDWRLLPSIAVIESGGGKAYKNNNIFGWNGGEQYFPSILSGLRLVAYRLGHSPLYRKHDSLGKLRVYNENEAYPSAVMTVMNRISPEPQLVSSNS